MTQVLLLSPPNFQGIISNTPSHSVYRVTGPGQFIAVDSNDEVFLLNLGFIVAAGPAGAFGAVNNYLLTDSSGNFIVPAGITWLQGAMTSGGGGGGGVSAAAATGSAGMQGLFIRFMMAVTPGQVIAYTNGVGGAAGSNAGGNGGVGGDTIFDAFTAKGGPGGLGSTTGNAAGINITSAVGLAQVNGSFTIPTTSKFIVSVAYPANAASGASGVGGQARGGPWSNGGTPGTNGSATDTTGYGGGGSGAGSTSNTAGVGGKGAPGAILVTC